MKKINRNIIILIFICFIIFVLSLYTVKANNKTNNEVNEEKIYYEIKYWDSKFISILNQLYNTNDNINWKELDGELSLLYNYWNSVILDLNYLDIDKRQLTNFGKNLDELSIAIKYMNKKSILNSLIKLYYKLIVYSETLNFNNYTQVLLTKYNLLLSIYMAYNNNWTLSHEYIIEASKSIDYLLKYDDNKNQYNINQAYVAVKEMENIINIKDIDVFHIKCKIALDKLENL